MSAYVVCCPAVWTRCFCACATAVLCCSWLGCVCSLECSVWHHRDSCSLSVFQGHVTSLCGWQTNSEAPDSRMTRGGESCLRSHAQCRLPSLSQGLLIRQGLLSLQVLRLGWKLVVTCASGAAACLETRGFFGNADQLAHMIAWQKGLCWIYPVSCSCCAAWDGACEDKKPECHHAVPTLRAVFGTPPPNLLAKFNKRSATKCCVAPADTVSHAKAQQQCQPWHCQHPEPNTSNHRHLKKAAL